MEAQNVFFPQSLGSRRETAGLRTSGLGVVTLVADLIQAAVCLSSSCVYVLGAWANKVSQTYPLCAI